MTFYGRVVDANGNGVPGIEVAFHLGAYPMFPGTSSAGDPKRYRDVTVTTDKNGNFELVNEWGIYIRFAQQEDRKFDLYAVGLPPAKDPAYGVNMQDRSQRRKLPDSPQKRVTYQFVPTGAPRPTP